MFHADEGEARCFAHKALIAGLLLCWSATSDAANSSQLRIRGKLLLQENCGRCHAIEAVGESPLKQATPMRDIYARFAPRELQAELREGMVFRHRAMPQIANRPPAPVSPKWKTAVLGAASWTQPAFDCNAGRRADGMNLFIPCFIDAFFPEVGIARLQLLERFDLKVVYPPIRLAPFNIEIHSPHSFPTGLWLV